MPTTATLTGSMPRSALRYRPLDADAVQEFVVLAAPPQRAGRTTQHATTHRSPVATRTLHPLTVLGLSMVATLLLLWAGQGLWSWGTRLGDDLRYGYPRTTQVDHVVAGQQGMIHYIATNVEGQIYLVEIPAGTPGASRLLLGPRLLGPNVELAPVMLTFEGSDVVVEVQGIVTRFPAGAP